MLRLATRNLHRPGRSCKLQLANFFNLRARSRVYYFFYSLLIRRVPFGIALALINFLPIRYTSPQIHNLDTVKGI